MSTIFFSRKVKLENDYYSNSLRIYRIYLFFLAKYVSLWFDVSTNYNNLKLYQVKYFRNLMILEKQTHYPVRKIINDYNSANAIPT